MSIFEENNVSIEKKISLRTKQLQLRENQWELSGNLPWLMFVKNVGMLKLLLMVESLLEILTNERSQMFCKSMDVYSVKNAIDEIKLDMTFFVVTCSCRQQVVNKLKGRAIFPDRMDRNHFDLIFPRHDRSCCTVSRNDGVWCTFLCILGINYADIAKINRF